MKTFTKGLLIAVLGIGVALPAFAGSSYYGHSGSHDRGVKSGEMVQKAAWASQNKHLRIHQEHRYYPDRRRFSKYRYNRFNRYHQRPYYRYRVQRRQPNLFWDLFSHNRYPHYR